MDSTDVLVILLSIGMSVVLLMSMIALFYAIKVLRALKKISEKAEHIAENIDSASMFFKKTAGPAAIGKLIANIVDTVKNHKK